MDIIPYRTTKVRSAVRGAIGATVAVPLLFAALPASAQSQQQEMQKLRDQMHELQQRFDQLQAQQEAEQQSSKSMAEKESAEKEGFQVGNTTIQLHGYFKLDAIYDFEDDHGTSLGPSDAIATLNAEGTDEPGDDNIGATIKQTRLKLSTTTPTPIGDIGGYVEMDFYGRPYDSTFGGGPSPRVRRAYLTIPLGPGTLLAGRDWSTFSDFNYGTMLNFYGPQSQIFERQSLVRYSLDVGDGNSLDLALESPEGQGFYGPGNTADDDAPAVYDGTATSSSGLVDDTGSPIPDAVIRYKGSAGMLSYQIAGIARDIRADVGGNDGEDADFGWGLDAGATLGLPTGTTLMATINGGEGIAKYVYEPAGGPDGYIDDNGDVHALGQWGFIGTISQALTDELTGNVVYGKAYSENPDVSYNTDAIHDESSTIAVNLLYTPVEPLTFGIEYNRATYEQQNGVDADANDIQTSVIYNF